MASVDQASNEAFSRCYRVEVNITMPESTPARRGIYEAMIALQNDQRTALRHASLAEIYLPLAAEPLIGQALEAVLGTRDPEPPVVDRPQLAASVYLPEDELLLLLFEPGSPAAVAQLLKTAGLAPLRIADCRGAILPGG